MIVRRKHASWVEYRGMRLYPPGANGLIRISYLTPVGWGSGWYEETEGGLILKGFTPDCPNPIRFIWIGVWDLIEALKELYSL